MLSDRIFGAVVILVALAYIAGATQIQTSFLTDPLGPKAFPILVGAVAVLCGAIVFVRPDKDPDWPGLKTLAALAFSTVILIGYAYSLAPLGFLIPTSIAAAVLSYQISPRALPALAAGTGLATVLFVLFKFGLGLGLVPFPKDWTG